MFAAVLMDGLLGKRLEIVNDGSASPEMLLKAIPTECIFFLFITLCRFVSFFLIEIVLMETSCLSIDVVPSSRFSHSYLHTVRKFLFMNAKQQLRH